MQCSNHHKGNFSILILVKTRSSETNYRKIARQLLQNTTVLSNLDAHIQYGFLIGQSNKNISAEIAEHKDFTIGDFQDNYHTLTLKTMMGYRWAIERCPDFNFVLSLDVDTHISLENLAKFLKDPYDYPDVPDYKEFEQALKSSEDFYAGRVFPDNYPVRNNKSVWHLSYEDYSEDIFPLYVAGMVVILSKKTVSNFYYLSPYVKHIRPDDVYFGILANKLGIIPFNITNFVHYQYGGTNKTVVEKLYKSGHLKNLLTVHRDKNFAKYL